MAATEYDFVITLGRKSDATVDAISQLMLFFTLVFSGIELFQAKYLSWYLVLLMFLLLGYWIFLRLQLQKKQAIYYRMALALAACCWFVQPKGQWMAGLFIIAALLERQVKFPREIAFGYDEVVINSFPKKRYAWSDFKQVIMKDRLLTLDFANNKLFQDQVEPNPNELAEARLENEFNRFVQERLAEVKS